MKTLKLIMILLAIMSLPVLSYTAPPAPPRGGGGGGPGGGGVPVGAPIDGGMGIMLALGLAYGGRKLYTLHKEKQAEVPESKHN